MVYIAVTVLGIIAGVLFMKAIDNKKILELIQENYELHTWKNNNIDAVEKNIELNKIQRNIRSIITKGRQKDEIHTIILLEIEKELSMNR